MPTSLPIKNIFSWFLMMLFVTIGILNLIYIHPVPFFFYVGLAVLYIPPIDQFTKKYLHFAIPYYLKITVALLVLWATLAVGDLMEYFESYLNH